jgi:hypothetical protein
MIISREKASRFGWKLEDSDSNFQPNLESLAFPDQFRRFAGYYEKIIGPKQTSIIGRN